MVPVRGLVKRGVRQVFEAMYAPGAVAGAAVATDDRLGRLLDQHGPTIDAVICEAPSSCTSGADMRVIGNFGGANYTIVSSECGTVQRCCKLTGAAPDYIAIHGTSYADMIRAVTHLDVSAEDIETAGQVLAEAVGRLRRVR